MCNGNLKNGIHNFIVLTAFKSDMLNTETVCPLCKLCTIGIIIFKTSNLILLEISPTWMITNCLDFPAVLIASKRSVTSTCVSMQICVILTYDGPSLLTLQQILPRKGVFGCALVVYM